MADRRTFLSLISLLACASAMAEPNRSIEELTREHRFFVGMHNGSFADEKHALDAARLPPSAVARGEFRTADGSRLLAFKSPPQETDTWGLDVLILQRTPSGTVHLWMSGSDLARATRKEAEDDVENYQGVGHGTFRIFERR